MAKPNLFIIGAMKSGTTSLHRYLAAHPDVFMCEPKEPGFFVEEINWRKGMDWYLHLYERSGNAAIVGESSTHYTKRPTYEGVAQRIHTFNPEARLIYVMRDPLDRIVSHYWHNVRAVRDEAERRDMLSAVQRDPCYLAYSDYAMQLGPYLDLFDRKQIALLTFEQLSANPVATVGALCDWLGLDRCIPREALSGRWNVGPPEAPSARGWGILNRFRNTVLWNSLRPLVPMQIRKIGTQLAEKRLSVQEAVDANAIDYLRPILFDRVTALTRLAQREFPEWTTVHGARPAGKTNSSGAI